MQSGFPSGAAIPMLIERFIDIAGDCPGSILNALCVPFRLLATVDEAAQFAPRTIVSMKVVAGPRFPEAAAGSGFSPGRAMGHMVSFKAQTGLHAGIKMTLGRAAGRARSSRYTLGQDVAITATGGSYCQVVFGHKGERTPTRGPGPKCLTALTQAN